jgi:hypothetical protein
MDPRPKCDWGVLSATQNEYYSANPFSDKYSESSLLAYKQEWPQMHADSADSNCRATELFEERAARQVSELAGPFAYQYIVHEEARRTVLYIDV